jgi:hypothetical protein
MRKKEKRKSKEKGDKRKIKRDENITIGYTLGIVKSESTSSFYK